MDKILSKNTQKAPILGAFFVCALFLLPGCSGRIASQFIGPAFPAATAISINKKVRSLEPVIKDCFDEFSRYSEIPIRKGVLKVKFDIERSGSVEKVRVVKNSVQNSTVDQCIVEAFQTLDFAARVLPIVDQIHYFEFFLGTEQPDGRVAPMKEDEANQAKIRRLTDSCYRNQLQEFENLRGDVRISFSVSRNGFVQDPSVTYSSLNNSIVEDCLLKRIIQLEFKTSVKKIEDKEYLFRFEPEK